MTLAARKRLETYASLSRTQSDEETYGLLERGANHAGDSAWRGERAGTDGAGSTDVDDVEHAARQRRLEMSDKHVTPTEVLECLRFVRTHLYAAQAQAAPGDDTIITRHVYDAYKRVSDVCREIEINGIDATNNGVLIDDMATMIRRLIHALYVAPTDDHGNVHPLCHKAKALLQKYGLQGSPLREDEDEA